MFTTTDNEYLQRLLGLYDVDYIYVGPLERLYYAGAGMDKFDQPSLLWTPVYENEQVKILKVNQ